MLLALISEVRGLAKDLSTNAPGGMSDEEGKKPLHIAQVAVVDVTVEYKDVRRSLLQTELTDSQTEELFKD